jgi:hypothetical protein
MEQLNLLAVALGLAALAGINLYLTVFASGLAIHFHWITLSAQYRSLEILGNPWIITVAGILYFLEFFADKIPWVDSIWDAVHTVIRPIGGAFLAIQVLGHSDPIFAVIVGLLAGGTSLASHTAKAATRLTANSSPEPFSNVALSLGEDVAVVGGLAMIYHNPIVALAIFAVAMAAFLYFAPKILRAMKAKIWLIWKKLNVPAYFGVPAKLPIVVPAELTEIFSKQEVLSGTTAWAVPCLSGRAGKFPANLFGALVAMNEDRRKLLFVARKGRRPFLRAIDLEGTTVGREPKFLSENLTIAEPGKGGRYLFLFPRSSADEVEQIVEDLRDRVGRPGPAAVESHLEPQATATS